MVQDFASKSFVMIYSISFLRSLYGTLRSAAGDGIKCTDMIIGIQACRQSQFVFKYILHIYNILCSLKDQVNAIQFQQLMCNVTVR